MFVVKGILLCLSFLGYGWLFYDRIHIKKHFVPITVLSWLSVVLFLLGLAGQLRTGAYGIYLLGFLFLGYAGWRLKKGKWNPKFPINMVDICFVGVAAIFLVLSFFLKMDHYDNFSHWAVIVKNLVATDQYPGLQDSIISFKDYPLGISVYLYYFARLWGYGQGILLFAQNLFLLVGFYAIFGIVREKKTFSCLCFFDDGIFLGFLSEPYNPHQQPAGGFSSSDFSIGCDLHHRLQQKRAAADALSPVAAVGNPDCYEKYRYDLCRLFCSLSDAASAAEKDAGKAVDFPFPCSWFHAPDERSLEFPHGTQPAGI